LKHEAAFQEAKTAIALDPDEPVCYYFYAGCLLQAKRFDEAKQAIEHAIERGNKVLSAEEQIPSWTPYSIRHRAATAAELEGDFEAAQTLLDHERPDTTARYVHGRLEKLKELARKRHDPFAEDESPEPEQLDAFYSWTYDTAFGSDGCQFTWVGEL